MNGHVCSANCLCIGDGSPAGPPMTFVLRAAEAAAAAADAQILNTLDPREELERVGDLASLAIAALIDEREGDFRHSILELHTRAAALLHLVATW